MSFDSMDTGELLEKYADLKILASKTKQEIADIDEVLKRRFRDTGLDKFASNGVTVYKSVDMSASIKEGHEQEARAALESMGIKPLFHAGKLGTLAKELLSNKKSLPDWLEAKTFEKLGHSKSEYVRNLNSKGQ